MVGRAEKRVLITGGRMPVSVEMAQLFIQAGAEVHVADSTRHVIADRLKSVSETHRLPPARGNLRAYGAAVEELVRRLEIDIVVPIGEEVFHLAAARERGYAIPLFASPIATLRQLHDKSAFIELARRTGMAVPETHVLKRRKDVDDLAERAGELVFKPCFSRFGTRTRIGALFSQLDDVVPSADYRWVAQERLDGEEFCAYAVALNGKLAAFSAYRPSHRIAQSAAFYFEPCELPDAQLIAGKLIAATAFTGQISLDLIRARDGTLLPIECNPRATSGLHFFRDQPELAAAILRGAARDSTIRPSPFTRPAMHRKAMWFAGLPNALRSGTFGAWRRDLKRGRDAISSPESPLAWQGYRMLASYLAEALISRRSLHEIMAGDIEWDGESFETDPVPSRTQEKARGSQMRGDTFS